MAKQSTVKSKAPHMGGWGVELGEGTEQKAVEDIEY